MMIYHIKKLKYVTIKTNSEEAKKYFCSSFKSKNIIDLLDRNIHATDPNENYEVLERTRNEVHTECFPERIVRFNDKKHKKTPWITTGILNSINRRNKKKHSTLYSTIQINDNTLGTSYKVFSMYLKSQFVNFYRVAYNLANCYVCESSNKLAF